MTKGVRDDVRGEAMTLHSIPPIEVDERRQIYQYVERNGAVKPGEIAERLVLDPEKFNHHVAILKRDGHLKARNGHLEVALDGGTAEEFTEAGVHFTIRPARQDDLSGIVGAIRETVEEKRSVVAETVAEQLDYEDALLRHNDAETRMFFVSVVDDDVVGWAHLQGPEVAKLSHTAEVTVGVLPEYRRHGMGSHLIQRSLSWAAEHGYEKLYNSIPATNEIAASFLEANGWETEAIRPDHYRIDGEYVAEQMFATRI